MLFNKQGCTDLNTVQFHSVHPNSLQLNKKTPKCFSGLSSKACTEKQVLKLLLRLLKKKKSEKKVQNLRHYFNLNMTIESGHIFNGFYLKH